MSMTAEALQDAYYSLEADREYMSASQLKSFIQCEAAAMAKLNGEWIEGPSDAMLAGSYVHAALEGTLNRFREEHPEIFTKQGELKAQFKQAETMYQAVKSDPFMMQYLTGLHEFIITVELFGVEWKCKLDCYRPERFISDLKTCQSLAHKVWVPGEGYQPWIVSNGYIRQLAIYAELERIYAERESWLPTYIVAVTKEDPCDKAVVGLTDEDIQTELDWVRDYLPRVINVKHRGSNPIRCESCRYCRATKKVHRVVSYRDLMV